MGRRGRVGRGDEAAGVTVSRHDGEIKGGQV